jgi:4-hydroxymandelate oxidase
MDRLRIPGSGVDELEQQARDRMTRSAYDFFAGGADNELTLADNVAAWTRLRLRPRVLREVRKVSTQTTVLGHSVSFPALVAPMALQRLAHDEGERATARGAAGAGTIMVTSTIATISLEDIAAAAPDATRWFQLYIRYSRNWAAELVGRATNAGYKALVFTVDTPVLGRRRRDECNRFDLPSGIEIPNLRSRPPNPESSAAAASTENEFDVAVTFDDLEWLAGVSDLPIVVKGVLRGDDARACLHGGARGIVVSNHGGRQLDTAIATADALPEIVEAVGDDAEVFVDGGVRQGTDILKALALGAQAVLVGRPVIWGLATTGATGDCAVLDRLREDFARALALCGAPSIADVRPDLIAHRSCIRHLELTRLVDICRLGRIAQERMFIDEREEAPVPGRVPPSSDRFGAAQPRQVDP